MIKYLKHFLLLTALLMIPLNLASQAAGGEEEDNNSSPQIRLRLVKAQDDRQDGSSKPSLSQHVNTEEEPSTSWGSWASYPFGVIKEGVNITRKFINCAIENPLPTAIAVFWKVAPWVAASCQCYCYDTNGPTYSLGCAVYVSDCMDGCLRSRGNFLQCNNGCGSNQVNLTKYNLTKY